MRNISGALPKTIAVVRIATSVFFLLFGQYKIFGSEFTHGGFQQYLQSFSQGSAVSFYQPILSDLLSLTLATWWGPGPGMPVWRYFGAELDHLPLLFLFVIFFVADAGQQWGMDGRKHG